jgi:hypothetical protein
MAAASRIAAPVDEVLNTPASRRPAEAMRLTDQTMIGQRESTLDSVDSGARAWELRTALDLATL